MVGQFADEAIGQTVFVDPGGIAEDAVEAQVGLLDAAKGCLQGLAYVFADGKDIVPAAMRVVAWERGRLARCVVAAEGRR